MDIQTFKASLAEETPPSGLDDLLRALWHERKGDWERAHEIVQDIETWEGAWVHAYLHRKEGDLSNAAYWYRRAGKPVAQGTLEEEWEQLVQAFVNRS